MNEPSPTRILSTIESCDASAADELLPLVYDELRRLAACKMAREDARQTLQATALVHEAYLKLMGSENQKWNSRGHFYAAAAEAMRRILIESARRKRRVKHGSGQKPLDVEELEIAAPVAGDELLAVHESLDRLATLDSQKAELVKLRFFVGLTMEQAAEVLGISIATAHRYWAFAKAWLYREVNRSE